MSKKDYSDVGKVKIKGEEEYKGLSRRGTIITFIGVFLFVGIIFFVMFTAGTNKIARANEWCQERGYEKYYGDNCARINEKTETIEKRDICSYDGQILWCDYE